MTRKIKTRSKQLSATIILLAAISFSSCIDDSIFDNNDKQEISDSFMFATTQSLALNVNVNDEYNNNYFYKVEVFDRNPFATDTVANLLSAGVAKGNSPFQTSIAVPGHVSTLYIRQTDPKQHQSVKAFNVDAISGSLNCDFGAIVNVEKSKIITSEIETEDESDLKATNYTLPVSHINLSSSSVTLGGANYYVPAGVTNTDINFGWQTNTSLYVAGNVEFNQSFYMPGNCKLIVLPGGKVTFNTVSAFEQSGIIVAVHPNASLIINKNGGLGNNSTLINDGTTTMNDDYEIRTTGSVFNNGSLKGTLLRMTNNSRLVNNQTIKFSSSFIMNTNATFVNNGSMEATGTIQTHNKTALITNNGHLKTNYLNMSTGGGVLTNNCSVECEDFATEGAIITCATGTSISCQDFYANNTTITLYGSSIFLTSNKSGNASSDVTSGVTFNHGVVINGVVQKSAKPLFTVWKMNQKTSWRVLQLNGTMEFSIASGYTPGENFYDALSNGVSLVEKPTVVIAETDCNGGGINNEDDNEVPVSPKLPMKVKEDNQYTFAMEDLWPNLGDYDMNDIVFKIHNITKTIDENNKVTAMSFDITPLAAGSTKNIAAALQFDEIAPDNITFSSTCKDSYMEQNQTNANVILFPNLHQLFGKKYPSITNTYNQGEKISAETLTYNYTFKTPVNPNLVIIDKLNFYSIVGDINSDDRQEIHLAGFTPSKKVKSQSHNYKDSNNMVWSIMLPIGNFKYPTESTKIYNAYPQFLTWAKSAGQKSSDWYLHPTEKSGLLYTK